jgi:hypothetical protein
VFAGQFSSPNSVAIDNAGNVYVTGGEPRVAKFDAEGNFLLTWGKDVVKDNGYTGPEICAVESQCQSGTQTEDNGSTPAGEGGAFGFDNTVAVSPDGWPVAGAPFWNIRWAWSSRSFAPSPRSTSPLAPRAL